MSFKNRFTLHVMLDNCIMVKTNRLTLILSCKNIPLVWHLQRPRLLNDKYNFDWQVQRIRKSHSREERSIIDMNYRSKSWRNRSTWGGGCKKNLSQQELLFWRIVNNINPLCVWFFREKELDLKVSVTGMMDSEKVTRFVCVCAFHVNEALVLMF